MDAKAIFRLILQTDFGASITTKTELVNFLPESQKESIQ
jgi:hypothetical protein